MQIEEEEYCPDAFDRIIDIHDRLNDYFNITKDDDTSLLSIATHMYGTIIQEEIYNKVHDAEIELCNITKAIKEMKTPSPEQYLTMGKTYEA